MKTLFRITLALASFLMLHTACLAQTVSEPANTPVEWSEPYPPFRIAGNLYYVGTADLACYLITTPKGNILINTGLANSAELIETNIKVLGFKLADTKILLTTQAHYDHMGAMAALKKKTGAKVFVNSPDAQVMIDGGKSDYALGKGLSTYLPVKPDKLLKDGALISIGGTTLKMLSHPGHTKGSCSFIFDVKDETRTYKVLIANMPTIVTDKKFSDVKQYPNIAKDYGFTLAAMKRLKFEIWLSSHASQFNLRTKHKPGDSYNPSAFFDRAGYDQALAELKAQYDKKMLDK